MRYLLLVSVLRDGCCPVLIHGWRYSIISAMDGSLPRKPCRTCKNRFHAGCLYKVRGCVLSDYDTSLTIRQWFNSSHSSSCPLCRSEIM